MPRSVRPTLQALHEAIAGAARPLDPDPLDAGHPALVAAILPFVRAANRRCMQLRADRIDLGCRCPALFARDDAGELAGPDLYCVLGSFWDVLGPDAPLYARAHDLARRRLQPFGAVLKRFGGGRAAPAFSA